MTMSGFVYIVVFFLVLWALTKPLGLYMARVFEGERTFLHPLLRPLRTARLQVMRHPGNLRTALDAIFSIGYCFYPVRLPVCLRHSAPARIPAY